MGRVTRFIGEPRLLSRDDMGILLEPSYKNQLPAEKLRTQHHRIARLSAAGLRQCEIAEKTGYAANRISVLLGSPAMKDLVAYYLDKVDASFEREVDQFHRSAVRNLQIAEDLISDRLDEASEDDGIKLPLRDLVAITADRADRFGYPRRQHNTNVNVNWADQLEKANERARALEKPDVA